MDVKRSNMVPGSDAYQDLNHMPVGLGGARYLSVIVDAHTRRLYVKMEKSSFSVRQRERQYAIIRMK